MEDDSAVVELSNHSLLIKKSTVRQRQTAIGHANRYVTAFKIQISTSQDASGGSCPVFAPSFDEVPESSFEANCEFLGKFSCYLKDHVHFLEVQFLRCLPYLVKYQLHLLAHRMLSIRVNYNSRLWPPFKVASHRCRELKSQATCLMIPLLLFCIPKTCKLYLSPGSNISFTLCRQRGCLRQTTDLSWRNWVARSPTWNPLMMLYQQTSRACPRRRETNRENGSINFLP